jgi:hypothetical protein
MGGKDEELAESNELKDELDKYQTYLRLLEEDRPYRLVVGHPYEEDQLKEK